MSALPHDLETATRPRLLVVSARYGLAEYDRAAMLPRLLGRPIAPAVSATGSELRALVEMEQALERARTRHDAGWRAARHVAVLTALLHEAQLCLPPATPVFPLPGSDRGALRVGTAEDGL